uniref:Silicatein-G2 n=1 Tax=Ephydatia fluviatilis TaxID=31330 RepID=B5U9F4_9METZ|nr:silicatein-G2 [Ephydatia fluviatilis]
MNSLILLCAITLAAGTNYELGREWNSWKETHGKAYSTTDEEQNRLSVWLANKRRIDHHNVEAENHGFTLAMNSFSDLTDEEFAERFLNHQQGNYTLRRVAMFEAPQGVKYADSVDWRTKGAVNSVKNQGQCGASYAFAAVASLEGMNALANEKMVALSEQNVIDCSVPYSNRGCNGGDTYAALKYVVDNGGIDTESTYAYKERQSSCQFNSKYIGATASGVVAISSSSESELMAAVATMGPVAVAVDANTYAFRYYQSGIFSSSACSSTKLNHAMVVTGYGTSSGKDYWLVKNSWGSNWGNGGYIMMARNKYNQCGIASDALFPTL